MPDGESVVRQSIQPTYDSRRTGPRFTVESRLNGRLVTHEEIPDPFVFHRVVIGWRDLLGFILRGRQVEFCVGGHPGIVEDVMELNADYLGRRNSTRRAEWSAQLEGALHRLADTPAAATAASSEEEE